MRSGDGFAGTCWNDDLRDSAGFGGGRDRAGWLGRGGGGGIALGVVVEVVEMSELLRLLVVVEAGGGMVLGSAKSLLLTCTVN